MDDAATATPSHFAWQVLASLVTDLVAQLPKEAVPAMATWLEERGSSGDFNTVDQVRNHSHIHSPNW